MQRNEIEVLKRLQTGLVYLKKIMCLKSLFHIMKTLIWDEINLSTSSLIWPSLTIRVTIFEKVLGPEKFPKTDFSFFTDL